MLLGGDWVLVSSPQCQGPQDFIQIGCLTAGNRPPNYCDSKCKPFFQDSVGWLEVLLFELIHVAIYRLNCPNLLGLWLHDVLKEAGLGLPHRLTGWDTKTVCESLIRLHSPLLMSHWSSPGSLEGLTQRLVQRHQRNHLPHTSSPDGRGQKVKKMKGYT